jgi:hypothetical protein
VFSRELRRPLVRAALSVPALALVTTGLVLPVSGARAQVVDRVTPVTQPVARAGFTTTIVAPQLEMVGMEWQGANGGGFQVRARHGDRWNPWTDVDGEPSEGPDARSREHTDRTTAGPVWVGTGVTRVQIKVVEGNLRGLKIHALHTAQPRIRGLTARLAGADPDRPGIVSRAQWGADESWKTCAPEYAPAVRFAVLHHTVTANDYKAEEVPRLLQGMYHFHTKVRGWCDLGYNVVVDRFGRTWEGRYGGLERPVIGAHAGGFNTGSVGISLLGEFTAAPVTDAMRSGLQQFLDWKLALHLMDPRSRPVVTPEVFDGSNFAAGVPVAIDAISTHRDLDATACPGDLAVRIVDRLRQDVQADILNSPPDPLTGWRPVDRAPALLVLDKLGGLHPAGSQPAVRHSAFWPRWPIARGGVRDGAGGYVLDGYGGVHPFGGAPAVVTTASWPHNDIARGIARGPSSGSGWVLDGYGLLHPYGGAPLVINGPYWPGQDIARGIATGGSHTGGYVLDGWGGVHPFGSARRVVFTGYWPGRDIARAIALRPDGASGWVLDGWGGLHPFGGAPAVTNGPYWNGWDIARGLVLTPEGNGGWVVDGWGGIHAFGEAPDVKPSNTWVHVDVTAAAL